MYYFKQNPILSSEILVYFDDDLKLNINKANYDSDEDAFNFSGNLCKTLNNNLNK